MAQMRILMGIMLAAGLGLAGCGVSFAPLPAGAIAGRTGVYNYSPSVIQSGNLQQLWWCGLDQNPHNGKQVTDAIQYASIDLASGATVGPTEVLAETPGAWDSVFTCNPKVVKG